MTNAEPVWITENQVTSLLTLAEAIPALSAGLRLQAQGKAASMPKTMLQFGPNNLHALGARLGDYVGTKTWTHTEGGTCPLLLLWNAADGQLAAVIEAFALGNMRTGGTTGVATDWLAREDAQVLAMAGTGKQALSQIAAVLAVRDIRDVRVYSPTAASREAFAARIAAAFPERGLRVSASASMAAACDGADVVTLATRAREPFVAAGMLARGAHLNAIGAIAPDREEFQQDVFDRTAVVAVDDLSSVQRLSREFRTRYGDDWQAVQTLSQRIQDDVRRPADADLTLFKAMGMGLSDVALGTEILRRARKQGIGRAIPKPLKSEPRFFPAPIPDACLSPFDPA
ncbi:MULTISPECIES: ornithine cyclodeaminase family protein [unclassified Achromobacter]|uniref:ornithine cyclodeaminase family protein n=1 Tax=unclassified Achromobacter TaxID=2626865 RepID=UPI000B51988C|nr:MULTISPECIES: ornithine cyclodeaminase family protein [unclassified Achromobacter]OWT77137.1 ornithine cyclodeaminase [Achromobacter sp. HZ28]OWT78018.1 ornithine cyclodeaminase [Achromobacter sp. HZ34]